MSKNKDVYAVQDAFDRLLLPATQEALKRGAEYYKMTWKEHIHPEMSTLQNVQHVIETHAETRIKQALERLDYGDLEGFVKLIGSAVGYLANACLKAERLLEKEKYD